MWEKNRYLLFADSVSLRSMGDLQERMIFVNSDNGCLLFFNKKEESGSFCRIL